MFKTLCKFAYCLLYTYSHCLGATETPLYILNRLGMKCYTYCSKFKLVKFMKYKI